MWWLIVIMNTCYFHGVLFILEYAFWFIPQVSYHNPWPSTWINIYFNDVPQFFKFSQILSFGRYVKDYLVTIQMPHDVWKREKNSKFWWNAASACQYFPPKFPWLPQSQHAHSPKPIYLKLSSVQKDSCLQEFVVPSHHLHSTFSEGSSPHPLLK